MFDTYLYISRYVFFGLTLFFTVQGIRLLLIKDEQKIKWASCAQRICILLFHVLAYSIIINSNLYEPTVLFVAVGSFLFFAVAFMFISGVYQKHSPLSNNIYIITNSLFFLVNIGLITITRLEPSLGLRQLIWLAVGLICFLFIPIILKIIPITDKLSFVYILIGGALLISPFFFGVTMHGATRWSVFSIGSFSISFQPSEPAKFLFVFYLACAFSKERNIKALILPAVVSMVFVLLLVAQTDLGTALIYFIGFMVLLYVGTGKVWLIVCGITAFSCACIGAYQMFAHLRRRVAAWLDPFADITDTGWQIAQALFAVGTWGALGSGLTRGLPDTIPFAESDFIFAAVSEEFGILTGIFLIIIYLFIFISGFRISTGTDNKYKALLACGFTSMLAFQSFLIISGNMRFLPLTGVTLPFMSYGGSSVIVSFAMIGIILWAEKN